MPAASVREGRSSVRSRPTTAIRQFIVAAAAGSVVTALMIGCGSSDTAVPAPLSGSSEATTEPTTGTTSSTDTCSVAEGGESDLPASYRIKGKELVGDVDGDGKEDRVSVWADEPRPESCRYLLVVESSGGTTIVAPVAPLSWPGTDPELRLLAEVDGRAGLEPVVALSPEAVYRPGAVFTMREGELRRMRLIGIEPPIPDDLFPFDDEFPAGVDCTAEPGSIVVTFGELAEKGDRHWDIVRSFYRAAGTEFEPVRAEEFRVEVGPGAAERWPELRGDPFISCAPRVD
jgi:hypothetical protein